MDIVRRVHAMREASAQARAQRRTLGLVPTMGCLHDGHLSLVRSMRAQADLTVVSIFVNPMQFGPGEDFARYPRDLARDADRLAREGADFVFAPEADEIYPEGAATHVEVEGLSSILEGASRPGHFRGVATVVAKLFEIVRPQVAVFGQKDFQQTVVVKRMVRDLMFDVEILVEPTVREADGLAMSSRNVFLSPDERKAATAIPSALEAAKGAFEAGERDGGALVQAARAVLESEPLLTVDYVALVDAARLQPIARVEGETALLVAASAGGTRLIDNALLRS
jgi:pantoate--beta-alanine ligase